jgi:23S rRNA (uracil1939-C5)-methyltransferase
MNIHHITIKKVINGGYGLARLEDGRAVMVRQALPGETVDIRVSEEKGSYLHGIATTIHTAHPLRTAPPCPYYGACGGCDLQHCDYPGQLDLKKAIIADLLERQPARVLRQAAELLEEPSPSPLAFAYRQRIRLQVDAGGRPGFRRFHSHEIVPVCRCLVASEELNAALAGLLSHKGFSALLPQVAEIELLADPGRGTVVCLCHLKRRPRPRDLEQAAGIRRDLPGIDRIFFQGEAFPLTSVGGTSDKRQDDRTLSVLYPPAEGTPALHLGWEVGGFCQVNLAQNRRLIDTVTDFTAPGSGDTVLDLFCGMGNFSIPLARRCRSLLGIEGQGSAIRSARSNSLLAGLANCEFRRMPLHAACEELARSGRVFDCVVIDPPRQGAPGLAGQLASLTAGRLVYISCDPATLCRDLADLVAAGFVIRRIRPVDMFPQTHHIETVVLLEKN